MVGLQSLHIWVAVPVNLKSDDSSHSPGAVLNEPLQKSPFLFRQLGTGAIERAWVTACCCWSAGNWTGSPSKMAPATGVLTNLLKASLEASVFVSRLLWMS